MYTAAQPPYQPFQPPSPPYQPPYNSVTEPLGMPCDLVMPNSEPNLPVAALVSQLELLTAIVKDLEFQMDANERCLSNPHATASPTSHYRTAAPLPAAAAVLSLNLPPPAPPCSSDISGDEGELLDDDPSPPAVISQPGGPNTSLTLVPCVVLAAVPSLINMGISESVKRDCSSSSIGKGIVTKVIYEFDDILIQAEGLHQQRIVICNLVFKAKILNDTFILLVLKEVQGEWRFSTIGVCATHAFDPGGNVSQ